MEDHEVYEYIVSYDNKFKFEKKDDDGWDFRGLYGAEGTLLTSGTLLTLDSPVYEKGMVYYIWHKKNYQFGINEYEVKPNMVTLGLCKNIKDYKTVDFFIELQKGEMDNLEWFKFTTIPYTPVPSAEGLRL